LYGGVVCDQVSLVWLGKGVHCVWNLTSLCLQPMPAVDVDAVDADGIAQK
jgi:hypothetical protein